MSAKANYFKIGLFVISGTVITVIAIIVLGAAALFRFEMKMETYIDESVQGLDVGSPVKYRGVQIGEVEEIIFARQVYDVTIPYVVVRMSIFPEAIVGKVERRARLRVTREMLGRLQKNIEDGLRVRMASQGITGVAFLEADYLDPERFPPLPIDWEPQYPYIPSAPGTLTRLTDSLDAILTKLEEINVQGITEGLEETLKTARETLEALDTREVADEAEGLLAELRVTNKDIQKILQGEELASALSDASATMASIRRTVEESEKSLKNLVATLSQASESANNVVTTQQENLEASIENVRVTTENLRELTENLKAQPSQLLFGEPPARSKPGGE